MNTAPLRLTKAAAGRQRLKTSQRMPTMAKDTPTYTVRESVEGQTYADGHLDTNTVRENVGEKTLSTLIQRPVSFESGLNWFQPCASFESGFTFAQ